MDIEGWVKLLRKELIVSIITKKLIQKIQSFNVCNGSKIYGEYP